MEVNSSKILKRLGITPYASEAIKLDGGKILITYHGNGIALINPCNMEVRISNAGWYTPTTKKRINQVLSALKTGVSVYQKNYIWYYKFDGFEVEYYNGGYFACEIDNPLF